MSTVERTRRRPRGGELAPYAILAIMIVALAMVPVVTQYTVRTANVYDIFQNFASYGLVEPEADGVVVVQDALVVPEDVGDAEHDEVAAERHRHRVEPEPRDQAALDEPHDERRP